MNYTTLLRSYPRYLGFGFLHMFSSSLGQTFLIALFIPPIRETFGQSAAAMGSWYGSITLLSALVFFFTGPLIDRINLRWFSVGAASVVLAGCLLLATSQALWWAILGLFCLRHGGQALLTHTASTTMARYFTLARGKALGIAGLGIAAGEACLPLLFALLLSRLHWQQVYLWMAAGFALFFVPLSLYLVNKDDDIQHPLASQQSTEPAQIKGELNWGRRELIRHPYFWLILPLCIMPPFLGTGFFFFQAEIAASKQWSPALFASSFIAYGVSAAVISFASGPVVDRWDASKMLPWALVPMMLGVLALITIPSVVGAYLFMTLIGISFGAIANVRNVMWALVYGRQYLGAIKSFAGTIMVCSTAIAPALGGYLLDKGITIDQLLWGSIWLSVGATLLALLARPPRPQSTSAH